MASSEPCPYCRGEISRTDKECKHCGRRVTARALFEHPPSQLPIELPPVTPIDVTEPKSADERRTILSKQLERQVSADMRVESRSDFQAVLVYGDKVNHLLHFFIGVFTVGLWWIVWILLAATNKQRHRMITVDEFGVARATNY